MFDLASRMDLHGTLARLRELARSDAVRELLHRGHVGATALHMALGWDASLELVRAVWDVMKDDPLKTNLFAIATNVGC